MNLDGFKSTSSMTKIAAKTTEPLTEDDILIAALGLPSSKRATITNQRRQLLVDLSKPSPNGKKLLCSRGEAVEINHTPGEMSTTKRTRDQKGGLGDDNNVGGECSRLVSQIIPKTRRNDFRCGKDGVQIPHYVDIMEERRKYSRANLTDGQCEIFDFVMTDATYRIILLQAGPGCGKSFVMQTLCHTVLQQIGIMPYVVILKRDLLQEFKYCASGFTVCQFFMAMFDLRMNEFGTLEKFVATNVSSEMFFNVANYLLQCCHLHASAELKSIKFMILDEYTMVPNLLLYVILQFVRYYNIRLVVCGDKNQLQCIGTSKHARVFSAYDIVSSFSDRLFTLCANKRCSDEDYNEKLSLLGRLSSANRVQPQGYAIIAAMCPDKLSGRISIFDTIIGSEHHEISENFHKAFINHYQHHVGQADSADFGDELWYIRHDNPTDARLKGEPVAKADNLFIPEPTRRYLAAHHVSGSSNTTTTHDNDETADTENYTPGKYLPYLPLIVGQTYFLRNFSETSQCRLKRINRRDASHIIETLTVEKLDSMNSVIDAMTVVGRERCNNCMFDGHCQYLINGGCDNGKEFGVGHLYNFPLYPAFYMTAHMSQGRTIRSRVSLLLSRSSYSGMYVSMSRVSSTDNINVIEIPNKMQYMLSHVMNFEGWVPRMCDIEHVIFERGYHLYSVYGDAMDPSLNKFFNIVQSLCRGKMWYDGRLLTDADRTQLYRIVAEVASTWPVTTLKPLNQMLMDGKKDDNCMQESVAVMSNFKNTFCMMSHLSSWDARVYLRVFVETERVKEDCKLGKLDGVSLIITGRENERYSYGLRFVGADLAVLSGDVSCLDQFLTTLPALYQKSVHLNDYAANNNSETKMTSSNSEGPAASDRWKPNLMNALSTHTLLFARVLSEYKRRVIDDFDADESRFYRHLYKHPDVPPDSQRVRLFDAELWYDELIVATTTYTTDTDDMKLPDTGVIRCECSSRQVVGDYEKEFWHREPGLLNRLLRVHAIIMGNCTKSRCLCGWRTYLCDEQRQQQQQSQPKQPYNGSTKRPFSKVIATTTNGVGASGSRQTLITNYSTGGIKIKSRRLEL